MEILDCVSRQIRQIRQIVESTPCGTRLFLGTRFFGDRLFFENRLFLNLRGVPPLGLNCPEPAI